jgi:cholesterol 7-desaturase
VEATLEERGYRPGYPNGWFQVATSSELGPRGVRRARCCGQELVVFRGEDGVPRALDAHCPHQGAHLAHGRVVGNCVECPLHGWRFDHTGRCTLVPYSTIKPRGGLRSWSTIERNQGILVWYHSQGHPPTWEPDEAPEASEWDLTDEQRMDVRGHIQEPCENQSDFAHFAFFHRGSLLRSVIKFTIQPNYQRSREHVRRGSFTSTVSVAGRAVYRFDTEIDQVGPGLMLQHNRFFSPSLIVSAFTPVDPSSMTIVRQTFTPPNLASRVVRGVFQRAQAEQAVRDVEIWNHKIHRAHPPLLKEDGPVAEARAWFERFYS